MHFPRPPHELQGQAAERARIWAGQQKRGLIQLCGARELDEDGKVVEGGRRCYHPLNAQRDPARSNDPVVVETDTLDSKGNKKKAMVGICSFDPSHGKQFIFPKAAEDELDN